MKTFRTMIVLGLLVLLVSCGGGSDEAAGLASLAEGDVGDASTTSAPAEVDAGEAALAFSQCMRDQGLTDFPDVSLEPGGGISFGPAGGESGFDSDSEEFKEAFEACGSVLEGGEFGRGGGEFDATEVQDSLLAMADCLRGQGLEVDDPDLSNFGPGVGGERPDDEAAEGGEDGDLVSRDAAIFGDLNLSSPAVQEAIELCAAESGVGAGKFVTGGQG